MRNNFIHLFLLLKAFFLELCVFYQEIDIKKNRFKKKKIVIMRPLKYFYFHNVIVFKKNY